MTAPPTSAAEVAEGLRTEGYLPGDATAPPPGVACQLLFFDPPYARGLVGAAFAALAARGWIAPGALLAVETERFEAVPEMLGEALASRVVGTARISVFRAI